MATIKDVAKAAGVSTATVSYVLNDTKPVGEEVRQRVLAAAKALNYQPNARARNLRRNENRIIGYELPILEARDMSPLMRQFTYQLTIVAAQAAYNLMIFAPPPGVPLLDCYRQLIRSKRVDGFILSNTNWTDVRIELLLDSNMPFVAFGRAHPELDFPFVDVDGHDGMRQVVEHLLDQGHERIAFVGWPDGSVSGHARYRGYCDTLVAAGIEPEPAYNITVTNSVEEGYDAAATLMAQASPPTAIACVSDILAVGAMRYLSKNGYRVGDDVAVSGFDDIPLADYLTPSLTTVQQPLPLIGIKLMEILLADIQQQELPQQKRCVLLNPALIIRESTRSHFTMEER